MTLQELRDKSKTLPLAPGVYLMINQSGEPLAVHKVTKDVARSHRRKLIGVADYYYSRPGLHRLQK